MIHEEIDNAIAVLRAHKEGKTIEYKVKGGNLWVHSGGEIIFNFNDFDYRIKSEPHYRPFETVEEVTEAIEIHGSCVKIKVNNAVHLFPIVSTKPLCGELQFYDTIYNIWGNAKYYFNHSTFADGTPFGVMED